MLSSSQSLNFNEGLNFTPETFGGYIFTRAHGGEGQPYGIQYYITLTQEEYQNTIPEDHILDLNIVPVYVSKKEDV